MVSRHCRRIIAVPALALLGALCLAQGAAAQRQASLVRVDPVRTEPLSQTVPVLGRLVARQAGMVSARINGPIEAFHVEVGDRVEAKQVIAVLNDEALRAARDQAAANVAVARAEFATKKAELALARQQLKRMESLKTSAAFNQARYDDMRQQAVIAQAEMHEYEAAVGPANSNLRLTQINLYNAEIRARYPGVVVQRLTEAGAYVKVGEPVVRMIADHSLEIEADVPYRRLAGVTPGTELRVTLDDGTDHSAVVRAIVPEENPLTRTRAVRLAPVFGATSSPLAADQSVTVHVPVGAPRDVLTVHKDAIIRRGDKTLVYVVVDEMAEARTIELGEAVGGRFEALSGLTAGELVVVRGNERLQAGDRVRIDGAS